MPPASPERAPICSCILWMAALVASYGTKSAKRNKPPIVAQPPVAAPSSSCSGGPQVGDHVRRFQGVSSSKPNGSEHLAMDHDTDMPYFSQHSLSHRVAEGKPSAQASNFQPPGKRPRTEIPICVLLRGFAYFCGRFAYDLRKNGTGSWPICI